MPNYYFKLPYNCITTGICRGFVEAATVEEAQEKIEDGDFESEEYEDLESFDREYTYSDLEITHQSPSTQSTSTPGTALTEPIQKKTKLPEYYLADIKNI